MTPKPKDPLLGAAKVLIVICQIFVIFGMIVVALVAGVLLTVGRDEMMAEIAKVDAPVLAATIIPLALLVGEAILFLAWRFLKELRGIVDSVGEGEPFRPENAQRLSRMGWIMVAGQAVMLPMAGLATAAAPYLEKADADIGFRGGLDFGSILLTLILFILARVFREGNRMREELEGTV